MVISGEGYDLLIAVQGHIPPEIRYSYLTGAQVDDAVYRVIPFEFNGVGETDIVKCIHPDSFVMFDEITGKT